MWRACSMRRSPEREDASSPGVDNRQAGERRLSAALAGPDPGPSPSYRAAAPRPRRLHHGRRCEWTIDRQGNDGSPPPLPGPIRPVPIARGRAPRPRRLHDARRCEWTIDKRGMHSSFAVRGVPPSGGRSTRSRGSATPGMARRHRRAAPHPRSGGGGTAQRVRPSAGPMTGSGGGEGKDAHGQGGKGGGRAISPAALPLRCAWPPPPPCFAWSPPRSRG